MKIETGWPCVINTSSFWKDEDRQSLGIFNVFSEPANNYPQLIQKQMIDFNFEKSALCKNLEYFFTVWPRLRGPLPQTSGQ